MSHTNISGYVVNETNKTHICISVMMLMLKNNNEILHVNF